MDSTVSRPLRHVSNLDKGQIMIKSGERTRGRQKVIANKSKEDKRSSTQIYIF